MTSKPAGIRCLVLSGLALATLIMVACDGPSPTGEGTETLEPPNWPLTVGDAVSELGRSRLSRQFSTIVPSRRLDEDPLRFQNADQERYGLAEFELQYVEADALTPGEDRRLYACVPRPEMSPNGALSLDEEEHWKTADGASTFFQPAGAACDPDVRYRARWVYVGHIR
ncbi:MAG: hypothetical protein OXK77_15425 [Gemmatimonadota bacterium]|nr:hypothetical protein [Gemmatimonadota bacterium]MDE2866971.1 hypothetical protein [Gemmatimonadota bacterium]